MSSGAKLIICVVMTNCQKVKFANSSYLFLFILVLVYARTIFSAALRLKEQMHCLV